jgi:hypothetical protein
MKLAVPVPRDLCADPNEKAIRNEVNAARARRTSKGASDFHLGSALVPCKHGRLRYLQFAISKQRILAIVEEDFRPSYLSGGSHHRSFALVDGAVVHDQDALWKRIRAKKKLRDVDIVNLLVTAFMMKSRPNVVLNTAQTKAVLRRWPEARGAFALAPPGLRKTGAGQVVLQAWTTGSYSERGVSCRYLNGWRLTFSQVQGIGLVHNHKYAAGRKMGQPCGKPLPGTSPKPRR